VAMAKAMGMESLGPLVVTVRFARRQKAVGRKQRATRQ